MKHFIFAYVTSLLGNTYLFIVPRKQLLSKKLHWIKALFVVCVRKDKAMYPSACFNLDSRKQKEKESLLYSVRSQKSSQVNAGGRRKMSHSGLCFVNFQHHTLH